MRRTTVGIALMCVVAAGSAFAHHEASVLGTVRITQTVLAGGETLQPGTYEIRDTGEHVEPLPGQSADAMANIELWANGRLVARTAAELIPSQPIAVGTSGRDTTQPVAQLLRGGDFLRVSLHHGGERYLIHLPVVSR